MRKNLVTSVVVVVGALSFLVWWNYARFHMEYPGRKLQLRSWYWRHFGDPFEVQARRIVGGNGVDCSGSLQDEVTVSNCITKAQREHRGFQLRYATRGIDTTGANGIVGGTDGNSYEVWYTIWNGYVIVSRRRCPEPLRISVQRDAWGDDMHCFPLAKSEKEAEIFRDDWAEHVKDQQHRHE